MNNIVLIGMPGSGKSTIGVLLAKAMTMNFIDTDLVIQQHCGAPLCDVIERDGIDGFKRVESSVLCGVECDNTVVATGGSAVYSEQAMQHLRGGGKTVYLKVAVEELERRIANISTRGIAMEEGMTLGDLFNERADLYELYADITIDCNEKTTEQCVAEIVAIFQSADFRFAGKFV